MWIFLNNAFVSAVQHNDDPELLVVRARVEGHLERFFGPGIDVERHPERDYLFRTVVSKLMFEMVLSDHAAKIDYGNFKDSIGFEDNAYHHACHDVWSDMNRLQGKVHNAGAYVR